MEKTSRISGFYKLPIEKRIKIVEKFADLRERDVSISRSALKLETADQMIENAIGTFQLPFGIATNFLINGKDYLIPMAIEETSVVAAASNAAKIARIKGGFEIKTSYPLMIGQIQILDIDDVAEAMNDIRKRKKEIMDLANSQDKVLVDLGGGAKDLDIRSINGMVIVHLLIDVRDAMGANAVNTMCEAVAPLIEKITNGRVLFRIISNLADQRMARARAVFDKNAIGNDVVEKIIEGYKFAAMDPYRAATHNKGIMNGIDAVAIATGNDWRAIEAGAHSYASRDGYTSLTKWEKNSDGDLVGSIELPMAVGIIGGATGIHPLARLSLKILGVESARELAGIIASVGLAQNFAALRALATKGIQAGHMRLHAKNIAVMAGATGEEIDEVAEQMIERGKINVDKAREILKGMKE